MGEAQNVKLEEQFNTNQEQLFIDTVYREKFKRGLSFHCLPQIFVRISGRSEAQNVKVGAHFNTNQAQFIDFIFD